MQEETVDNRGTLSYVVWGVQSPPPPWEERWGKDTMSVASRVGLLLEVHKVWGGGALSPLPPYPRVQKPPSGGE